MHHFHRWGPCLAAIFLAVTSISCTMAREYDTNDGDSVPVSPNARLYTYFIVVGMARGATMLGHLRQQDLPSVMHMDEETRLAIIQNLKRPSVRTAYRADQMLSDYLQLIHH